MMRRLKNLLAASAVFSLSTIPLAVVAQESVAQPQESQRIDRKDDWEIVELADKRRTFFWKFDVYARAEPIPALRYRFVDDEIDMKNWNAAIFYLRAFGYLDQEPSRTGLAGYWTKSYKEVEGKGISPAPSAWLHYRPHELPIEEVKEFLQFTQFQLPDLKEAQRCKSMNFERHIRDIDSPATLLLPDLNIFRSVCRDQSLRYRLALAENRVQDAFDILRQQFAMARHLSQDVTLVSNLVGTVVSQTALDDAIYLIQRPDSPNLYWALTTLPDPTRSMSVASGLERRFMLGQISLLKQVDLLPLDDSFCESAISQIAKSIIDIGLEGWPKDIESVRSKLDEIFLSSHTQALSYLEKAIKIPSEQLKVLSSKQIALLAMVRYYERRADDLVKWSYLPYWQVANDPKLAEFVATEKSQTGQIGELTSICNMCVATADILSVQANLARKVAFLRNIEAVRMYASEHGRVPRSLQDTPVAAPQDPVTGKYFEYQAREDGFELSAQPFRHHLGMKVDIHVKPINEASP